MSPAIPLTTLQSALGGELCGNGERSVERLAPLDEADAGSLAFIAQPRYEAMLRRSRAGAVMAAPALVGAVLQRPDPPPGGWCAWVFPDPYLAFARLTQWWRQHVAPRSSVVGIHPSAWVHPTARIGAGVSIGPFAVIDAEAVIGDGATIGARAHVQARAAVGAGTHLGSGVVLGYDCRIGAHGIVHAGTVIGADGFGFAPEPQPDGGRAWVKIEQLGAVRIGDAVEIGANCCIDRGALGDTVLEDGVKLDNLIQIGHNVRVGRHTAMAGCVGVAGSARIGAYCTLGGGAIVLGHLELADHVHISAASVVMRSIRQPGHYSGVFPIDDNRAWEKNAATLRQLHALRERLKALERRTT